MSARAAVLAVALAAVAAAPARANDKRAAAAHFQQGRALYDAGQYADALAAFESGYEAFPLPGFLVNIGQCQRKLDRLDDASDSFRRFLASNAGDERLRAEISEALGEITTERARRADAEAAARRARDDAEARRAPEPRPDLTVHAAAATATAPVASLDAAPAEKPQKKRRWVWAVVGALAAGAVASAVAVGVVESQPAAPRPGSLGLLDGRR